MKLCGRRGGLRKVITMCEGTSCSIDRQQVIAGRGLALAKHSPVNNQLQFG
jgi:hypothetical protein